MLVRLTKTRIEFNGQFDMKNTNFQSKIIFYNPWNKLCQLEYSEEYFSKKPKLRTFWRGVLCFWTSEWWIFDLRVVDLDSTQCFTWKIWFHMFLSEKLSFLQELFRKFYFPIVKTVVYYLFDPSILRILDTYFF